MGNSDEVEELKLPIGQPSRHGQTRAKRLGRLSKDCQAHEAGVVTS